MRTLNNKTTKPIAVPLIGEGVAMLACLWPSLHYHDGNVVSIILSGVITIVAGVVVHFLRIPNRRQKGQSVGASQLTVTLLWLIMTLFATLPFMLSGIGCSFTDAFFEAMSGLSSTGATIFDNVELLPPSLLLWRSISQWIGGFGIILLVLAIVPHLGINKYSLYTAEASGADNTGKTASTTSTTVRRTLSVYLFLTLLFVVALTLTGMTLWESVNITFTNISTGGFSIYADSIARFTPLQQYIITLAMFVGGVNFALLYNILTFNWSRIHRKLDQFGFYILAITVSVLFVVVSLHLRHGMDWSQSLRYGVVQTVSVITTSGSVVADTNLWWTPILFLFLILSLCGGMAGSTTGGIKIMRVLILFRNVRNSLNNRLHPNAVNPVRLNGRPVSSHIIHNVMVILIVYAVTSLCAFLLLLLCGVSSTESIGAVFGQIASALSRMADAAERGGAGRSCGGFGSYASFPATAKWLCSLLMLLGRLECLTVFILFLPGFWRRR